MGHSSHETSYRPESCLVNIQLEPKGLGILQIFFNQTYVLEKLPSSVLGTVLSTKAKKPLFRNRQLFLWSFLEMHWQIFSLPHVSLCPSSKASVLTALAQNSHVTVTHITVYLNISNILRWSFFGTVMSPFPNIQWVTVADRPHWSLQDFLI